jgi:hypothetical protein
MPNRLRAAVNPTTEGQLTTWGLLLLLLAGVAFGIAVLYGDYASWDERHRDFARDSGAFNLWVGLMCAQTAVWAIALAWLLPVVRRLRREYGDENRSERIGSTAVILVLIVALAVGGPRRTHWPDYLQNHTAKIAFLTLVGALVGLVAAQGVWLVHGGLKRLARGDLRGDLAVPTFLSLQADLNRFLSILGVILGLIVLSASAQRQTVLEFAPSTNFPYEGVLLYGLFFSILVAAVYVPTHLTLASVGASICDQAFPAVPPSAPEWEERTAKRERLAATLDLDVGLVGRFKASVAIMTPLLGSLVGLLLK